MSKGGLPRGWAWAKLDEVRADDAPVAYGILQPGPDQPDGVPYIRPTEIVDDEVQVECLRRTTSSIADEYRRSSLASGDVLISIVGTIGKVAIIPPELTGANITQSSARIRPRRGTIEPAYLRFVLKAPRLVEQYDKVRLGTGVPRLNIAHVRDLDLPIAPFPEQQRIVAKIEALQARSDAAKQALDAIPLMLEKFRQSVLAAAFRGDLTKAWREAHPDVDPASKLLERIRAERRRKWEQANPKKKFQAPDPIDSEGLPELPDSWCWVSAAEIVEPNADIVYGIVQPGPPLLEGVPYVRGMDIQDGVVLVDQLLRTSPEIAARYARASLLGGDVLLGIIRATKVAIVPHELAGANITQGTARFRPSSVIRTDYLANYLDSSFAQSWLHAQYRGIDMPGLNLRDVRRLPVALCPIEEQRQLEQAIVQRFTSIRAVAAAVEQATSRSASLAQSILAKAFRGELVPQDPNDEPASVLLERIRAAREASAGPKRTTRHPRKPKPVQ